MMGQSKTFNWNKKAFVVTSHLGTIGGGALAPLLLCQELTDLGIEVTAFTESLLFGDEEIPNSFHIITPWFRKGCRWDIPERVLSFQVEKEIKRQKPEFVFMCGVTKLASSLLRSGIAGHLLMWEFTNATPQNKLVDQDAIRRLNNCRSVLSPSPVIDKGIRETYNYKGNILRLPFWVTDHNLMLVKSPETFSTEFIYLGRRDVEKGLNELVNATAVVAESNPDVRVLITGPGSDKPFRLLAEKLGIEQNISFKFFKTYSETMETLATSKYIVLPSYHEGYPLVLLEAAERSVPFISTDVGSVKEVFNGSGSGLIIPPNDVDGLANAMLQVLSENEKVYQARRSAARAVFERVSSKEVVRKNLVRVLDAVEKIKDRRQ
ncbi:glycosyltransferase family 4 protein [Thermodesulfobacteriota bacterium]